MTIVYNKRRQTPKRKYLRNNATEAEKLLWQRIKNKQLGVKFRRQYGIGYYIADFCCPRKKIVIELDGGVHNKREQKEYDGWRSKDIEELGFKILRFSNDGVKYNVDDVLDKIKFVISEIGKIREFDKISLKI